MYISPRPSINPIIKYVVLQDEIEVKKVKNEIIIKNDDKETKIIKTIEREVAKKGVSSILVKYNANMIYTGNTKK